MSKKMLKRSLVLGALMAFVITGSAMAADESVVIRGDQPGNGALNNSVLIGNGADRYTGVWAPDAVAIGSDATVREGNTIAIGNTATAFSTGSTAIGFEAEAQSSNSVALGTNATTAKANSIAIGYNAAAGTGTDTSANSIAIGCDSSTVGGNGVAVGPRATVATEYSAAVGNASKALGNRTVAFGHSATANNNGDVALGFHAITSAAVSVTSATIAGNSYNFAGNDSDGFIAAASFGGGESTTMSGGETIYRQLQNVAAGQVNEDSTDAVNGSQLYAAFQAIDATQASANAAVAGLNQRLDRTNTRLDKVGAGAAALAALHPLEYDPDDKMTFSAGMGNYAGENAAALGAFYRPNEKFMVSLGGTMGNGENMVNLGLSIGLDKPNGLAKLSKRELIQKVNAVEAENDALEDRVAKLEALVAQLASK